MVISITSLQGLCSALLILLFVAPLPESVVGVGGPCSTTVVVIEVRAIDHIYLRLGYDPLQTVNLKLFKDLTLTNSSLTFNASFSCTIFTTSSVGIRHTISASTDLYPAFQIYNTHNVLVQNVGFYIPVSDASPICPIPLPDDTDQTCGAIYIHSAWGIQITQATVRGRIDICHSPQTTLDWLSVTSANVEKGVVQIFLVGDGPNAIKSDVVVSNCNITGSQIGLAIARGGVGITIRNNWFQNQNFTGIQCGFGVQNVGDCMLNSFINNYFIITPDFKPIADSAAMYFGTHWVNPGNYLSCNYAVGGKQCLYLDYCSSGITVEGMVCIGMPSGLKLNTGHSNNVSSFISVGSRLSGWISCQNYLINNCNQPSGMGWDRNRLNFFNSLDFQQKYPWLNSFCDLTSFNGVDCNPLGSVTSALTGACSGMPTGNKASILIVSPATKPTNPPTYLSCTGILPVLSGSLNTLNWTIIQPTQNLSTIFINPAGQDYGLLNPSASIPNFPAGFKSCPKSANGPQTANQANYYVVFNSPPGPAALLN